MATASCTFSNWKAYKSGSSSWGWSGSPSNSNIYAGGKYVACLTFRTPTFSGTSSSITVGLNIIWVNGSGITSSTPYVKIGTVNPGSSVVDPYNDTAIGPVGRYSTINISGLSGNSKQFVFTINNNQLKSNTTYYLWIYGSNAFQPYQTTSVASNYIKINYTTQTTPTNYTITYYRNFFTSDNTKESGGTVASGKYYVLDDCHWTRQGYSFNGWVASRSSSVIYNPGAEVQAFKNQTWYATWVQNVTQYTVKFYPGDHATVSNTSANAITRYTENGSLKLLSNTAFTGQPDYTYYTTNYYLQGGDVTSYNYPSSSSNYTRSGSSNNYCYSVEDDKKTDYNYEYWYGSDTSGVRKCGDTYNNLNQDINMWPDWTGTVKYNAQFNPPDASRTGYRLSGWATRPTGTPNYQSGTNYQQSSNQNLYAIWEANEFKITFSPGNYGRGSSEQLTTTNGQLTTLPSNYFTRPAGTTYYFNYYLQGGTMSTPPGFSVDTSVTYGPHYQTSNKTTYYHNYWNTDPNGTSQSGEGVNYWNCNKTYTFTSNMTLYPEWGSRVPKYTLPTPTKVGYKFVAWNTNAQGTGTNYAAGTEFALRSNKTFYAIWEPEWTIKINNGTSWGDYHVWIYTGATSNNGWQQAIPYVYDGSNWKLTKI